MGGAVFFDNLFMLEDHLLIEWRLHSLRHATSLNLSMMLRTPVQLVRILHVDSEHSRAGFSTSLDRMVLVLRLVLIRDSSCSI